MNLDSLFTFPDAVWILLLAPLLWLVLHILDHARARRLERIAGIRAHALASELSKRQRQGRRRLFSAGLLLALAALLQPIWGEGLRKIDQRGVDIIVCLDVSQSMLARDLPPSRLERAKAEISALSEKARGDRLGLVIFAGEARLFAPLTQDIDSFIDLVRLSDPLLIERGGTDLGAALETALSALKEKSGNHEVVLLITDGEDHEQRGLSAAELFRERNIKIHCVGFGSAIGSKITITDERGESFLRDNSGVEVVSSMAPGRLFKIAETTGGEFLDAGAQPLPLVELYEKRITPMARKMFKDEGRRTRKNRFQWPLLAAFLLWIMEICLTDRKIR